jgi:hypothetical protein
MTGWSISRLVLSGRGVKANAIGASAPLFRGLRDCSELVLIRLALPTQLPYTIRRRDTGMTSGELTHDVGLEILDLNPSG